MARLKEAHDSRLASATREKGLIVVNTGAGKGSRRPRSALSPARPRHAGRNCPVDQGSNCHRRGGVLRPIGSEVTMKTLGEGFTWDTQDRQRDIETARLGWAEAVAMLRDPAFDLVVLDELNIVIRYEYLPLDEVLTSSGVARNAPRRDHGPQCPAGADRAGRPRDRDEADQASLSLRGHAAKRDRVLRCLNRIHDRLLRRYTFAGDRPARPDSGIGIEDVGNCFEPLDQSWPGPGD